ncbi:recombination regulator RecX [Sulfuritortus calidifontis]|uniref:recombination regulator RecX n=1 Tax=Sulfuritortus calidifontis TaxID=1914471 RepID=UPI000F848B42|nr:recombination regulator RecX [Sulfuritortus calidifontis]
MAKSNRALGLRERALNLLARREHSRAELARKLAPHGEADEIAALLDDLEQRKQLSDARYAESLAHARAGKYGSRRLAHELREKGVGEGLIADAVAEAREGDLAAARVAWAKKFGAPPSDANEQARQYRFLLGRGFPNEVVRRVVGGDED